MTELIFDIEADNLLYDVSKVWCIVTKNIETKEVKTFDCFCIKEGLKHLGEADVLIGHNVVGYDLQVLKKLYGFEFKGQLRDTLLGSRLHHSRLPKHSLKFWGEVLVKKGLIQAGKTGFEDWSQYSEEMLEYCVQDVEVNYTFYMNAFSNFDWDADYVRLEHDILAIQTKSETFGVSFQYEDAMKLQQTISLEMDAIKEQVEELLGYHWDEKEYRLKNDGTMMKTCHTLLDKLRKEYPEFNHRPVLVSDRCLIRVPTKVTLDTQMLLKVKLLALGWKGEWKTAKGALQLSREGEPEPNLSSIPGMEGVDVGRYYVLKHRLSIVSGFFKNVRSDGKIPSEANTLGAITGRYTHRKIANLPAPRSLYGMEIRSLFGVDEGYTQVGADLAGIEARILAHFMEDEEFTKLVSEKDADIHTFNQKKAGLPSRDAAKTFYYAFLYGGGDAKIGSLVGGKAKEGAEVKDAFFKELPGLKVTIDKAQREAQKGYVISLDERKVYVTKSKGFDGVLRFDSRKALNTLLQSSAAIFFKRWLWFVDKWIKQQGLDANLMISYHDEGQWAVKDEDVEKFKRILLSSVELTDNYYKVKCNNDIDIKTGKNWGDCH